MFKFKKSEDAFSLVELLITLAVLGIIVSILVPRISNIEEKTKDAQIHTVVDAINQSMSHYYLENNNRYPLSNTLSTNLGFEAWNELFGINGKLRTINLKVNDLLELKEKYNIKEFKYISDGNSFTITFKSYSTETVYTLTELDYN